MQFITTRSSKQLFIIVGALVCLLLIMFAIRENVFMEKETYTAVRSGDLVFSIPEHATVAQADAGLGTSIFIYKDEESLHDRESLIYSILYLGAVIFETGEPYSFQEWLHTREVTLTGETTIIDGIEFVQGHDATDTYSWYGYVAQTEEKNAHVIVLPIITKQDKTGKAIQDSLRFDPTQEQIDSAETIA